MLISVINLTGLYLFMQDTLEEEVNTRATIVLQQVDAIQKYVQTKLRPRMLELDPNNFVLEAMSSSFISRSVMENANPTDADYVYRRVAINARNPLFEASDVELELINYFRDNQETQFWSGMKTIDEQKVFVIARPARFVASCMLCHGNVADAPKEIIDLYGTTGFGHTENNIDGVDLVGVPTGKFTSESMSEFTLYVMIYLIISVVVLIMIFLTFQKVVLVNFRTLTSQFRKNFHDQKGLELLQKVEHGDEIEEMIDNIEILSQHMYETDQRLKEYTADLEQEVNRRTEQLSIENDTHKKDLNMLVSVLGTLKISRSRSELWYNTLPLLAERFTLVRASYICTFSNHQNFSWPKDAIAPILPDDYVQLLLQPTVRFSANQVFVPVASSDENVEGLLFLERPIGTSFSEDDAEMLTAVGRQLGIAAENLAALDSIFSQSKNLQTIFDGIANPLLLLDNRGTVIIANHAAHALLEELSCQEMDKPIIDCLFNSEHLKQTTTEGTTDRYFDETTREITLKNGRSFIVNTFALASEENKTDRAIVSIQEDTARKKMLQEFVQAEKLGTVGKLAAGLAHELNNPLGVILCYAELLKKSCNNEQQQSDIDVIINHTSQAQSVLLDLLNFARPKVSTHRETVIGDVTESVVAVFRAQAAKKNATIHCQRHDEGRVVRVEPQVVEHIVLNLLINALDALPENEGKITVHVTVDEIKKHVKLKVSDNGSGIDPALLSSIFDPFFTTKDINKGTGLGLSILYGYMHELGGTIEARNQPDSGAIFELRFPIV